MSEPIDFFVQIELVLSDIYLHCFVQQAKNISSLWLFRFNANITSNSKIPYANRKNRVEWDKKAWPYLSFP